MGATTDSQLEVELIREVPYAEVARWRSAAAKERTAVADSRDTSWYVYGDVACAGLLMVGTGVRIKGVFVAPQARGRGIGTLLTEHLIELSLSCGATFVEAYAWNPGWYESRGFKEIGRNQFGAVRLRRNR